MIRTQICKIRPVSQTHRECGAAMSWTMDLFFPLQRSHVSMSVTFSIMISCTERATHVVKVELTERQAGRRRLQSRRKSKVMLLFSPVPCHAISISSVSRSCVHSSAKSPLHPLMHQTIMPYIGSFKTCYYGRGYHS